MKDLKINVGVQDYSCNILLIEKNPVEFIETHFKFLENFQEK